MRRHRQRFGPISRGERQNADLFFAELVGRTAPRAAGYPRPTERYIEWTDEQAPLVPRATTVTPGSTKDEIIVTRADGTRFRVRRKVRAKVLTQPGRLRTGFCTDDNRVFFRLRWCQGTQGTIDLGANPQGAFKDLMDKVFRQINQGASPDAIRQTFENASVQAFLDLDITKIGSFTITGDIKLDINRSGITSASGRVSADTGWIKVGVEAKAGADGKQVLLTVDIPLSKRKIAGKECPVRELAVWWEVECVREVPITVPIKPPVDFIEKHEQLLLYFDHAKATLRRDPKSTAAPADEITAILRSDPAIGTARLNKRALERLDYLVAQGYWLTSVAGYTSPEGKRPKPSVPSGKWEGNDALSLERAEKVRALLAARYGQALRMRPGPGDPPIMRFPPGQQMPQAVGRSEQPKLNNKLGSELEGPGLDRAIIVGDKALGVKPFLEEHPDELARMTDEDQKVVTDKRLPLRKRAERLFENLRRVEIHLKQRERLKTTMVPVITLEHVPNCPKDLVDAAERQWGSRVPFTKRDPPICL